MPAAPIACTWNACSTFQLALCIQMAAACYTWGCCGFGGYTIVLCFTTQQWASWDSFCCELWEARWLQIFEKSHVSTPCLEASTIFELLSASLDPTMLFSTMVIAVHTQRLLGMYFSTHSWTHLALEIACCMYNMAAVAASPVAGGDSVMVEMVSGKEEERTLSNWY